MNRKQRRAAAHISQPNTVREQGTPTISEAKLVANRANAQHSSGPKSDTGRATSAQNHTTHGLARHNGKFRVFPPKTPLASKR